MHISLPSGSVRLLALGLLLLAHFPAHAQKTYRGSSGGSWFTSGNWSPSGVPTSSSEVSVNVNRTVAIGSAGATARILSLDNGGTVSVSGASATLSVVDYANIGEYGHGALSVSGGGKVTIGGLDTGIDEAATATITVTGAGSKLTVQDSNYIGFYGGSTVTVSNGGHYDAQSDDLILGYQNVSTGTDFTVTGSGSKLTANWVAVGNFGKASLVVSDGATVSTGGVAIAYGVSDGTAGSIQGSATVTGAGSRWDLSEAMGIGTYGGESEYTIGSLTIADGGTVQVGAGGTESVDVNRFSTLRIGDGGASGTLSATSVTVGGRLVFDHTDDVEFDVTVTDSWWTPGAGSLEKEGSGTLTLSHVESYTGSMTVKEGTLVMNAYADESAVTVQDAGTLAGNGGVGALTLGEGGTLSPGSGIGILQTADVDWLGGSTYRWEVARDADDCGPGWDLLIAVGSLNLGGTSGDPLTIQIASLGLDGDPGAAADFDPTQCYTWVIAIAFGGINGFDADAFAVDASGFVNAPNSSRFSVSSDGTGLYLNYSAVPEPATYAVAVAFLLTALVLIRRRRAP